MEVLENSSLLIPLPYPINSKTPEESPPNHTHPPLNPSPRAHIKTAPRSPTMPGLFSPAMLWMLSQVLLPIQNCWRCCCGL